ncbi:MAG: HAD family hydrolase [Clostridiales bacterium]|nr:HAD family hydrolase [Clostridiales bacterium]
MNTIIFDFDGTLSKEKFNIWKLLWLECGYSTDKDSLYAKLYKAHTIDKLITRKEWFDLTCKAFKDKGLTKDKFKKVSEKIELIDGTHELIKELHDKGYKLCIVSGCIKQAIEIALKDSKQYFDVIQANEVCFDENNIIDKFIITPYDFKGKATFITEFAKKHNIKTNAIVFVGNGINDEFAFKSGCKTLCINPEDKTQSENKDIWHDKIDKTNNLYDLMDRFEK